MVESIFTSQTPATPDANDGASTLGTVFTAAVNGTIDGCRWFAPSVVPSGTVQALLYQWTNDATGTLLAQINFGAITPGTWNTVNYAAPVAITAGQRYVTCIFTNDHYCFTNFVFTSSPIVNGNLTAVQDNPGGNPHNGKFIQNATPAYPTQEFRQSNYFVDVLFTAAAAPSGQTGVIATSEETDVAFPFSIALGLGTAEETDEAFPITVLIGPVTVAITGASEVDEAFAITPIAGDATIPLETAEEVDEAFSITALGDQVVAISTAEETDAAFTISPRSAGVATTFNSTGPCSPLDDWQPIWCEELSPEAQAVTGDAVEMAADILWIATGQRFGLCTTTIRPCREDCSSDWFGVENQWWPGVGGMYRSFGGGGPRPWWYNGVWYNVCGGCAGSCSCTVLDSANLPAPTREVVEVKLDGAVLDPSKYRVDENRKLVRTDGLLWPMCQDMAADDDQPGTWSVTITVGEDVPKLARRAVGQLAAEFAKDCAGEACQLPYEITSLSRQGINMSFGSPDEVDAITGQLNLRWVNLFINTYNPSGLRHRAKTYDVDRNPRPWRRVDTS